MLAYLLMGAAALQFFLCALILTVMLAVTGPFVVIGLIGALLACLPMFAAGVWTLLAVDVARNVRLARRRLEELQAP